MDTEIDDETINDLLPEEILLKTFEFLSFGDLTTTSLVCKKWNDIISNNQSTMKSLTLILPPLDKKSDVAEVLQLKRMYYKVQIMDLGFIFSPNDDRIFENLKTVMKEHGKNVRQLVFKENSFSFGRTEQFFDFWLSILLSLPKLEKLTIINCRLHEGPSLSINDIESLTAPKLMVIKLAHLKEVVIQKSSSLLLDFIELQEIVSLKDDGDLACDATKRYESLEELAHNCSNIFFDKCSAPLKKLALIGDIREQKLEDVQQEKSWCLKECLEKLDISGDVAMSTYINIINTFRKLQLLKLKINRLPLMDGSERNLTPNLNVKTLILHSRRSCINTRVEPFIENLPNVESLVLDCDLEDKNNQLMTFIAMNLTKLKSLEIRSLKNETFENVSILTLRELLIRNYGLENDLTSDVLLAITANCPNIEKLTIENFYDSFRINDILAIITNLKKLKFLYIGDGFVASREVFDCLRNCQELKRVTVIKNAIDDDPSMIDDFTQNGPQLALLDKPADGLRTDFNLWLDDFSNDNFNSDSDWWSDDSDFSHDIGIDEDERDDDIDDWYGYDDEDNSDDEFPGAFRPG